MTSQQRVLSSAGTDLHKKLESLTPNSQSEPSAGNSRRRLRFAWIVVTKACAHSWRRPTLSKRSGCWRSEGILRRKRKSTTGARKINGFALRFTRRHAITIKKGSRRTRKGLGGSSHSWRALKITSPITCDVQSAESLKQREHSHLL